MTDTHRQQLQLPQFSFPFSLIFLTNHVNSTHTHFSLSSLIKPKLLFKVSSPNLIKNFEEEIVRKLSGHQTWDSCAEKEGQVEGKGFEKSLEIKVGEFLFIISMCRMAHSIKKISPDK